MTEIHLGLSQESNNHPHATPISNLTGASFTGSYLDCGDYRLTSNIDIFPADRTIPSGRYKAEPLCNSEGSIVGYMTKHRESDTEIRIKTVDLNNVPTDGLLVGHILSIKILG